MALDGKKALAQLLLAVGIGFGRQMIARLAKLLLGLAQAVFFLLGLVLEFGALGVELLLHALGRERFLQDALHVDDRDRSGWQMRDIFGARRGR